MNEIQCLQMVAVVIMGLNLAHTVSPTLLCKEKRKPALMMWKSLFCLCNSVGGIKPHNDSFVLFYGIIGDSPARAFEAGNQINGHYPCHCGTHAGKFMKSYINLAAPKYLTFQDRMTVISRTRRWKDRPAGMLSVYDSLDVSNYSNQQFITITKK